jgi:phage terminase Nu1 subunit (DNA packaging protein)
MAEVREDALLNGRQCAESIGISQRAFQDWKVPVRGTKGRQNLYALQDVLKIYRARVRRELERELRREIQADLAKTASPDQLPDDANIVKLEVEKRRVRLLEAQAEAQEMKNEMARHEVAPFEWHAWVFSKTASVLVGMIDSLPVEMMRKLNLKPKEVEKVKAITATALDSVSQLSDREWLEESLDDFIEETGG